MTVRSRTYPEGGPPDSRGHSMKGVRQSIGRLKRRYSQFQQEVRAASVSSPGSRALAVSKLLMA
jgi:hypothetical protein